MKMDDTIFALLNFDTKFIFVPLYFYFFDIISKTISEVRCLAKKYAVKVLL